MDYIVSLIMVVAVEMIYEVYKKMVFEHQVGIHTMHQRIKRSGGANANQDHYNPPISTPSEALHLEGFHGDHVPEASVHSPK